MQADKLVSVAVGFPFTASYQLGMNGKHRSCKILNCMLNITIMFLNDLAAKLSQSSNGALCGANVTTDSCCKLYK